MNAVTTTLNAIVNTAVAAQMDMLEADVSVVLSEGSIKNAMKEANDGAAGQSRDLWQVKPSALSVIANLNPRVDTPAYRAHIRALADSMIEHGFYQDKPLAGYVSKENGKDVIYIYEGGSRLKAALLAIEEGAKFEKVPVSVNQKGVAMEDILVAMVRGNTGRPLTPYENAVICKRLAKFGWEVAEIAKQLGFTVQHTDNLLKLMSADARIRAMVADEVLAFTMAIDMINEHAEKAFDKLSAAQDAAKSAGKTRITKRFTAGAAFAKASKKAAAPMFDALQTVKADPAFASLSETTQAMLVKLVAELEAVKATDAPTKQEAVAELKAA